MKRFTLKTKIAAATIATTFINAIFIATKFIATSFANASLWDNSWMMKLKMIFDFSRNTNAAEAKKSLGFSFPRTEVRGYTNNNLSSPRTRVSTTRNVKWILACVYLAFSGKGMTMFVIFFALLVCLTKTTIYVEINY